MKTTLKVAHVVFSLEIGGLEKVAVDIINHFDRKKIEPKVYCVGMKGEYAKRLEDNGVSVFVLAKKRYPLRNAFSLAKIFKKEKIDIIHSHSGVYRDAVLGGMIARIPIIVHTDHGRFYPESYWTRMNHWFFSNFRDRIITVSDEIKDFITQEVRIPAHKIVRIHNGVDLKDHANRVDIQKKRGELGIDMNSKVIGIVARLASVKDHTTLFSAFKKVRNLFPEVKLLVVGDGPLKCELVSTAAELGEDGNIVFLGNRTDVNELFHIMDIACLSSLSEGLSMTLTEAMASGKPVVATRVGGNPELVDDGVTGFLVPPNDPDKMAEAILKLLREDELRNSMGQKARERVKKEFDINTIVKEYEKLYFDLAKEKGIL